MAVEVFHNFTLLHDDIMDNAPLRRGKPTVHKKWTENTAILSGDVMLIRAYDFFLLSKCNNLKLALEKFNRCAAKVCEGQQYDMHFETQNFVSEDQYLEMIKLKTAALLAFSIELGAIVGGADANTSDQLYEFGLNIGIGFQLKDDLLDVYHTSNKFGKQIGGDIISNKKTYLLIKALELSSGDLSDELKSWIDKKDFDPEEKVAAVTRIFNELNIKELTEAKMNSYFERALDIFASLDIEEYRKSPLKEIAQKLMDREK